MHGTSDYLEAQESLQYSLETREYLNKDYGKLNDFIFSDEFLVMWESDFEPILNHFKQYISLLTDENLTLLQKHLLSNLFNEIEYISDSHTDIYYNFSKFIDDIFQFRQLDILLPQSEISGKHNKI